MNSEFVRWLLGDELLHDEANALAFRVGRGKVVTLATQVAFRVQTRASFKLLFNAIFQGPAESVYRVSISGPQRVPGDQFGALCIEVRRTPQAQPFVYFQF